LLQLGIVGFVGSSSLISLAWLVVVCNIAEALLGVMSSVVGEIIELPWSAVSMAGADGEDNEFVILVSERESDSCDPEGGFDMEALSCGENEGAGFGGAAVGQ
jgi:hypothetical protein